MLAIVLIDLTMGLLALWYRRIIFERLIKSQHILKANALYASPYSILYLWVNFGFIGQLLVFNNVSLSKWFLAVPIVVDLTLVVSCLQTAKKCGVAGLIFMARD